MVHPESLIPEQHTGISKEIHQHIDAASTEEADELFKKVKGRLVEVNAWAHTAEGTSAKFLLCDYEGNPLNRSAQQGDLVRIDLPGPHRSSDSGYDWVILDLVSEGVDVDGSPWIVLRTRPTSDPQAVKSDDETAHFFSDASTGTFVIRRRGLRVEASHYGRNELPNTDGSLLDTARAVLVTAGAYLGLSDIQWSNLVEGLLSRD